MRKAIVYILRAFVVTLFLLPLLVPTVRKERTVESREPVNVLISQETELTTDLRVRLINAVRANFGSQSEIQWHIFGSAGAHPILRFEELGNTLQNTKGNCVVVASPKLWGPAARKFNANLKKTDAFKDRRIFWFEPESTPQKNYVGLSEVFLPNISFLGEESIASVEVVGQMQPNSEMAGELVIRSDGSVLTSKVITLKADENGIIESVAQIPVNFVRAGTQILTANLYAENVVPPLDSASTTVNISHSKATLLHIAVGPDWSLRNLRQKLKFWPNLDLLSYYILREAAVDDWSIPSSQISLIEFPTEKLFGSELPNFHGIIVQNFPLDHYLNEKEALNLVDYVRSGGRIVLFAGPLSFQVQDPNIRTLLPCDNTPNFETDTVYKWEPGSAELAGNNALNESLMHITSKASVTGCKPKEGSMVLAQTTDGKHPAIVAMPLEKGLVLAFLSGDWHTHFASSETTSQAEKARRILAANAAESLFQWMVEFLQRRQDSGMRPPDIAGPRLYSDDTVFEVRSRGATRLDSALALYSNNKKIASGVPKHLSFLGLDIMETDASFLSAGAVSPSAEPQPMSLYLQFSGNDDAGLRARSVNWPVIPGTAASLESLPNPVVNLGIPPLSKAENPSQQSASRNNGEEVPLLEAFPWLLALALALLALEEFLSHILWRPYLAPQRGK